jgi:transcription-repair coupling factor (superfamily II helicase)
MNLDSISTSKESLPILLGLNQLSKKNIYIFPTDKEANEFKSNFSNLNENIEIFPSWDTLTYDSFIPSYEIQGKRLAVIHSLLTSKEVNITTSIKAVSQRLFFDNLDVVEISTHQEIDFEILVENLIHLKYSRKDRVEAKGTFAVRGGQLDVYPINKSQPVRLIFDGDTVVELRNFDPISQRSSTVEKSVMVVPATELFQINHLDILEAVSQSNNKELDEYELFQYCQNLSSTHSLFNFTDRFSLHIVDIERCKTEFDEIVNIEQETFKNLQKYFSLKISNFKSRHINILENIGVHDTTLYSTNDLENLQNRPAFLDGIRQEDILKKLNNLNNIYLASDNEQIIKNFSIFENLNVVQNPFSYSVIFKELGIAIIDESLFFTRKIKKPKKKAKTLSEESILIPNTYIVHSFHGIGLYEGTVVKRIKGVEKDYLSIKFGGSDKLFVPSEQINELEVYIGGENPKLSSLGGAEWERAKEKAKENAKIVADRVLNLYKLRNIKNDSLIISEDTPWQNEIESNFEYIETPDQLAAITDVKADLEKNIPMDRLIFGDVGYGKTEVALRAAIKVAFSGGQVALLAPTTILVQQHIETFLERLNNYPLNIKHLSRFVRKKEISEIVQGVTDGSVDILIGTHRILSKDIEFKNLKLIIIDEEHRFGVEDKDKLQSLTSQTHKLTLTATPIPRTLEQSLMGIRDTSKIETPPENRLETLTHVGGIDESSVLNRIEELQTWMKKIQTEFPKLNHRILHGQLSSAQIEKTMQDVWDKKVDVLFATTIVEAGIDLPKVNTLITLRSELLGMSQLYQLKGRVGRRGEQSFAYFFHNENLSVDAELRLDAIKSIGQTATGYSLSMKDLQLRGSGSILGDIQSGFIANVGLNIFNKYVMDSIEGKQLEESVTPATQIKLECFWGSSIPKSYIEADSERIDIYKRLEHTDHQKVDEMKAEILDRFGATPEVTENLFFTAKIRSLLQKEKIIRCKVNEYQIELFPIDLTESINSKVKDFDRKFLFRNKRLVVKFKNSLSPEKTYQFLNTILSV